MKQFFVAIWLLGCGPPGPEPEPPKEPLIDGPTDPNAPSDAPATPSLSPGLGWSTQWRGGMLGGSGDIASKSATLAPATVSICPTLEEHSAAIPRNLPADR